MFNKIKKILLTGAAAVMMLSPFSMTAAADNAQKVVDNAGVLYEDDAVTLENRIKGIVDKEQFDIVILTDYDTGGKSAQACADDYYDYNGYGQGDDNDGVLLLISMAERDYWITTTGFCIEAITDYGRETIEGDFLPALSAGSYADAFRTFAAGCETLIQSARTGNVYDYYSSDSDSDNGYGGYYNDAYEYFGSDAFSGTVSRPFNAGASLVIALVIGFVLSLITVSAMKGKLKTVHRRYEASNYVVPGSLDLRQSEDRFLYSNVTQTPIPQHEDNHSSHGGFSGGGSSVSFGSSGVSHGGGGGKF